MTESDCIPLDALPGTTRLFRDVVTGSADAAAFYAGDAGEPELSANGRAQIADLLEHQNRAWGAGDATMANIARLRAGAQAVVTGQQVSLFGGPLYSFLKAATAVSRALQATANGIDTVPVFWMASEDHDFAEVRSATVLHGDALQTVELTRGPDIPAEAGSFVPDGEITRLLAEVSAALGDAPHGGFAIEALESAYAPGRSMAEMFARFALQVFAAQGIILLDASERAAHALGSATLRAAIERADELHDALEARTAELVKAGYHAQVSVAGDSSLLFLLQRDGARVALKRTADGWRAGTDRYTSAELLQIASAEPERLSPSALLRPVFQDSILPTALYVGGPAEVAYFAQTNVLYRALLGRVTPIAPRLSATIVPARVLRVLQRDAFDVSDVWRGEQELALRLGARAMPIETKQKLAAAGVALDSALRELTETATGRDAALGHSAVISSNKMRYQMNRLRRLMARFEEQREPAIARRAKLAANTIYPHGHLQERVLAGAWALAEAGESLAETLVTAAAEPCPGHRALPV